MKKPTGVLGYGYSARKSRAAIKNLPKSDDGLNDTQRQIRASMLRVRELRKRKKRTNQ